MYGTYREFQGLSFLCCYNAAQCAQSVNCAAVDQQLLGSFNKVFTFLPSPGMGGIMSRQYSRLMLMFAIAMTIAMAACSNSSSSSSALSVGLSPSSAKAID